MLGVVFGLFASLGFGSSAVFARLGLQHMRPTTGTMASLMVGAVIAMVIAFALNSDEIFALSGMAFAWFTLSGAVNFLMGRLLNFTAVGLAGVSRTAPLVGSSPLFAAILAVTIGGETISPPILAGTAAIIGGLALILTQKR